MPLRNGDISLDKGQPFERVDTNVTTVSQGLVDILNFNAFYHNQLNWISEHQSICIWRQVFYWTKTNAYEVIRIGI